MADALTAVTEKIAKMEARQSETIAATPEQEWEVQPRDERYSQHQDSDAGDADDADDAEHAGASGAFLQTEAGADGADGVDIAGFDAALTPQVRILADVARGDHSPIPSPPDARAHARQFSATSSVHTTSSVGSSLFPPPHRVGQVQQQHRQQHSGGSGGGSLQSAQSYTRGQGQGQGQGQGSNSKFSRYLEEWDRPDGELSVALVIEHAAAAAAALGPLAAAAEDASRHHEVAAAALEKLEAEAAAAAEAEANREEGNGGGYGSDSSLSDGLDDGADDGTEHTVARNDGADATAKHRAALALHVRELDVAAAAAETAAAVGSKRYTLLRPTAIKLWGSEAAVHTGLIEEALGGVDPATREDVVDAIASVCNVGQLAKGQRGRVVHSNQFVDVDVVGSGDGGETWELVSVTIPQSNSNSSRLSLRLAHSFRRTAPSAAACKTKWMNMNNIPGHYFPPRPVAYRVALCHLYVSHAENAIDDVMTLHVCTVSPKPDIAVQAICLASKRRNSARYDNCKTLADLCGCRRVAVHCPDTGASFGPASINSRIFAPVAGRR